MYFTTRIRYFTYKTQIIVVQISNVSNIVLVISSYQEPLAGWTNNVQAFTGALTSIATGFIKVLPLNAKFKSELIPVDFVANGIIAAGYQTAKIKTK